MADSEVLRAFAGGGLTHAAEQVTRGEETIGTNLSRNLPELAPVLMALDAVCFILDEDSQESLPLSDFYLEAGTTVLGNCGQSNRVLGGLVLPGDGADRRCFCQAETQKGDEFPSVRLAVALKLNDAKITAARLALGGVAPTPVRCHLAEDQLLDLKLKDCSPDLIEDVAIIAAGECDPLNDERATADCRRDRVRELSKRLIGRALEGEGHARCPED